MNDLALQAEFLARLQDLLVGLDGAASDANSVTYDGAGADHLSEHATRRFFIDELLDALGWTLGLSGDVAEEATIKVDETNFIDYVCVSRDARAPLLIVEAKAWDKPFLSRRRQKKGESETELMAAAVDHVTGNGSRDTFPGIVLWFDYLTQIQGYVRDLYSQHEHEVARVVLTSGQWLVVFVHPVRTFVHAEPADSNHFVIFHKSDYLNRSADLLELLRRDRVVRDMVVMLRPHQLASYCSDSTVSSCYRAIHIKYEKSGASRFTPSPRILAYPSLVIERTDGVRLIAIEGQSFILDERSASVDDHLRAVEQAGLALLRLCSDVLGLALQPADVTSFRGFPAQARHRYTAQLQPLFSYAGSAADEWTLVTGQSSHYLRSTPLIADCRFHAWSNCYAVGYGAGNQAISISSVSAPRSYFTDGQPHHCAHQAMLDLRSDRCKISFLDTRGCCQSCTYSEVCWARLPRVGLPCGS